MGAGAGERGGARAWWRVGAGAGGRGGFDLHKLSAETFSAQTLLRPTQTFPRPIVTIGPRPIVTIGFSVVFHFSPRSNKKRCDSCDSHSCSFFSADLALGTGLRPPSSNFRDLRFSTTRDPRSTKILTTEGTRPAVPPSSNYYLYIVIFLSLTGVLDTEPTTTTLTSLFSIWPLPTDYDIA